MRQHYRLAGLLTSQADDGVSEFGEYVLKFGIGIRVDETTVETLTHDPRDEGKDGQKDEWSRWI